MEIENEETNNLKMIHLNVRSYFNNRNALEYMILQDKYDIYIFTETWL